MLDEIAKLAESVGGALSKVSAEGKEVVFRMMDTLDMCLGGVGKFGQPILTILNAYADERDQIVRARAGEKAEIAVRDEQIKALQRWSNVEFRRQKNLEKIVGEVDRYFGTAQQPEEGARIEQTPEAAEDWVYRFIDYCKDVGAEDVQQVWSRILAGELEQPGSIPFRLMHTVSLMTKSDAEIFCDFCPRAIQTAGGLRVILVSDPDESHFFPHLRYLVNLIPPMDEAGLIDDGSLGFEMTEDTMRPTTDGDLRLPLFFDDLTFGLREDTPYQAFFFTESGNRLADLINAKPDQDYKGMLSIFLRQRHLLVEFADDANGE